jgi:uncharacterized ferritin-like protein (DUF455 family)
MLSGSLIEHTKNGLDFAYLAMRRHADEPQNFTNGWVSVRKESDVFST